MLLGVNKALSSTYYFKNHCHAGKSLNTKYMSVITVWYDMVDIVQR